MLGLTIDDVAGLLKKIFNELLACRNAFRHQFFFLNIVFVADNLLFHL